jgi:hypothetical protein
MVRPGLLIVLLASLAPLYIIAIQPELHASSGKSPDSTPTYSVVNVTPCVTTAQGANLECPVSYTAGDSLVLNVSLDTGSDTFFTPQSVIDDASNTWVADTLSGGVTCQSDNNSDYSECYYHANNITGTSANITVTLPPTAATGYMAAYVYEISGGPLLEDVAASRGYPDNPYSLTVDTPLSGTLAGSADILFGSAAADWPDGVHATLESGPSNGFTGEDFLNAGGQDPNSIDLLSAYLIPGTSASTSTEWTVVGNQGSWASVIIAYEPAAGTPTPTASATATGTPTATATTGNPTATATATPTATATTATATATPTATATASASATATSTVTATSTATATATPTVTATASATPTATPTTSMVVTASVAFGKVAVGQTVTKNVTINNTGATNPLTISSAIASDPEYSLSGTGTCGAIPIVVAPKKNCTMGVSFAPSAIGAPGATLSVFDNATTSPQHVTLTGTSIAGLSVSKTSLVYGSIRFGLKSALAIAVVNHQTQPVTLSKSFSGTNPADFSITGGSCGSTLAANKSCTLTITFKPGALGTESATLTISDSPDPLSPYAVALSTGPTIPDTVAATTLSYGTVKQTSSKTLKTTVTNYSPFTISVGSAVSGANSPDFTITGGTCGASLAGNSSCTVGVKFVPTTSGAENAALAVTVGSDPMSPRNVTLKGTGS